MAIDILSCLEENVLGPCIEFWIPVVTEMQLQFTGLEHLVWHFVVD